MRIDAESMRRALLFTFVSYTILAGGLVLSRTSALAAEGEGPTIDHTSFTSSSDNGATLEAQIDPEDIATTYEFWVESAVCTGGSATCERSGHPHKEEEGYIDAGSGSKTVTDDVTDLLTDTYFWYWVVAENLGGTVESSHGLFETGTTTPSSPCSDGCPSTPLPYETGVSKQAEELGRLSAEGAPAREAARQQAAKEQAEREAAAKRADQPVVPATISPPTPATGSVSLAATNVTVQGNSMALVKLSCLGIESCHGKLTLTAKIAPKAKGKKKPVRTTTIGTVSFSIVGDETKTIRVSLNTAGHRLLREDHGRLSASLAILELAPGTANTQTKTVRLVVQKIDNIKQ